VPVTKTLTHCAHSKATKKKVLWMRSLVRSQKWLQPEWPGHWSQLSLDLERHWISIKLCLIRQGFL